MSFRPVPLSRDPVLSLFQEYSPSQQLLGTNHHPRCVYSTVDRSYRINRQSQALYSSRYICRIKIFIILGGAKTCLVNITSWALLLKQPLSTTVCHLLTKNKKLLFLFLFALTNCSWPFPFFRLQQTNGSCRFL
jgi:hypothetical protein